MRDAITDIQMTLMRLEALLASGVLRQAEAASCASLAEALRRPARVAILGQSAPDVTGILRSLLDEDVVEVVAGGPAVEVHHGDHPRHVATFEDGSSLSQEGYPGDDLMRHGPLFLQVESPAAALSSMSFLAVELGHDAATWTPAMSWAAKRSEIAIFCANDFSGVEAGIWSSAPDRLKNHCYLVMTGSREASAAASARTRGLFDAVIHAPAPSEAVAPLTALSHRLTADIATARQEDVDAAELFLHRFRRVGPEELAPRSMPGPAASGSPAGPAMPAPAPGAAPPQAGPDRQAAEGSGAAPRRSAAREAARALVSAPILHLKRRSRALAEMLEWREEGEEWTTEVLNHCCETAEALRDLVASWPEDDPLALSLRDAIDRACDTVILLQVEDGPSQAEDAARVLYQLRTDFEQAMAA